MALETAGEREAGLGAVWDAEGLGCSLGGAQKPSDAFKKRSVKGCSGEGVGGAENGGTICKMQSLICLERLFFFVEEVSTEL